MENSLSTRWKASSAPAEPFFAGRPKQLSVEPDLYGPNGSHAHTSVAPFAGSPSQKAGQPDSHDPDDIQPFRVMALPAEVRQMIWRFALVRPKVYIAFGPIYKFPAVGPIVIRRAKSVLSVTWRVDEPPLEGSYFRWNFADSDIENVRLLQTDRQIYEECAKVYYSENLFAFGEDYTTAHIHAGHGAVAAAQAFLRDRSPRVNSNIRHLEISALYEQGHSIAIDHKDMWLALTPALLHLRGLQSLHLNLSEFALQDFYSNLPSSALSRRRNGLTNLDYLELRVLILDQRKDPRVDLDCYMVQSAAIMKRLHQRLCQDSSYVDFDTIQVRRTLSYAREWVNCLRSKRWVLESKGRSLVGSRAANVEETQHLDSGNVILAMTQLAPCDTVFSEFIDRWTDFYDTD